MLTAYTSDLKHSLMGSGKCDRNDTMYVKPGNIVKCQRKFKLVDPYCTKNVLQMYLQKEDDNWNGWLYLAP